MICSAIRRRLGTCGRPAGCLDTRSLTTANWTQRMKDFSNASFAPDLIAAMDEALAGAGATVPHPVSSRRVQHIAESSLRSAEQGGNNPRAVQTMALLVMQPRADEEW